ncbi:MAG: hypothetical protein P8N02_00980 [Actinomycetota bacterium]|jgi:hypothetical protein|nr:hypothetical protein [Actinomycetota bacterium]
MTTDDAVHSNGVAASSDVTVASGAPTIAAQGAGDLASPSVDTTVNLPAGPAPDDGASVTTMLLLSLIGVALLTAAVSGEMMLKERSPTS